MFKIAAGTERLPGTHLSPIGAPPVLPSLAEPMKRRAGGEGEAGQQGGTIRFGRMGWGAGVQGRWGS